MGRQMSTSSKGNLGSSKKRTTQMSDENYFHTIRKRQIKEVKLEIYFDIISINVSITVA